MDVEDLIQLESQINLFDLILECCIDQIDMSKFKNNPQTYICNIGQLKVRSMELNVDFQYKKNRKPSDDTNKVQNIIEYQNINFDINTDTYDTADWKLTFCYIGNDLSTLKLIDGGHRFEASMYLPNIHSVIQILHCENETQRFEKFKLINTSSDLPEIFKVKSDDIYLKLIKESIAEMSKLNYFRIESPYIINDIRSPFLNKLKFEQYLFDKRDLFFGKCEDFLEDFLENVKVFIKKIIFINNKLKQSKNLLSNYQFLDKNIKLSYQDLQCRSLNSKSVRCGLRELTCSYHQKSEKKYKVITYIEILNLAKTSGIYIGLYSCDEILVEFCKNFKGSEIF